MRRRSSTGSAWVTSLPSRKMRPDVGSMSRLTILSVVVLPQPDGPTSTQISPSRDVERELAAPRPEPFGYCLLTRRDGSSASDVIRGRDRRDAYSRYAPRTSIGPLVVLAEDIGSRSGSTGRGSRTTPTRSASGSSSTSSSRCSRCCFGLADRAAARVAELRYRRLVRPGARDHRGAVHDPVARAVRAAACRSPGSVAHDRADPARRCTRCSSSCGTPSPASTACPPT